jgi:hypothetical protein
VIRPSRVAAPLRFLLPCMALLLTVFFTPALARSQEDSYLEQLQKNAVQQRLSEERTWKVLLHYTKTLTGGERSRIDDRKFFLSPQGRVDRQAELAATLSALFVPPQKDGEYAACRFPARFEWLNSRLGIDPTRLPAYSCTERDKALGAVAGQSAVLVFPVGHINSPASMFGHTLIRIDSASKSNLISYAGNYAAVTTDTNGFIYAWKGLFGKYKGYYSLMPYYIKVKEYNDLEHRDMWEYRMKLSQIEVKRMLNHIWELQGIQSSYYFLDENCSYNLLFLIEAARPELHLTEKTGIFVLPTQTIGIAQESGILEEPRYRPSQGTRIRHIVTLLHGDGQQMAYDLAYGIRAPGLLESSTLVTVDQIKILDAAIEFLQFRLARKELGQDDFNKRYLSLLGQRSKLGAAPDGLYDLAPPSRPESGHPATKIALGGGVRRGEAFSELEVRPEFHSLLDPDRGYLRGAQIKFLDTALDYRIPAAQLRLRSLHLVDILSLAPRDVFFSPLSWKVNTGLDTETLANGKDHLLYRLNTGGGYAVTSVFGGIWYALGEIDVNAGSQLRAGVTAGPGLCLGALEQFTDWWKLLLSGSGYLYKFGDDRRLVKLTADQNFRLTQSNSLSLQYSLEFVNRHRVEDARVLWNYYY